jgi:hypothetical protein
LAIVTNVGMGCGGRGNVGRASVVAGRFSVSNQSAQTNGAFADGKTVWSWHPLLVSSWRRFFRARPGAQNLNPPMTVTRRIRRRGEHGISRKTIAQGRRNAPTVPVCSCAFSFVHFARETAGAASTRRSLRPLLFGRNDLQSPGETRRGNAEVCFHAVIARSEATKQSILPLRRTMDCFASLAMTLLGSERRANEAQITPR